MYLGKMGKNTYIFFVFVMSEEGMRWGYSVVKEAYLS